MSRHGSNYDLPAAQQQELIDSQLAHLRADRFQRMIDIRRWEAIPTAMRDGTEQPAINHARAQVTIIESQIDTLTTFTTGSDES